jgi:hypothetical protein
MNPDLLAQVFIGGGSVLVAVLLMLKADDLGDGNVDRIERDEWQAEARWWLAQMQTRRVV